MEERKKRRKLDNVPRNVSYGGSTLLRRMLIIPTISSAGLWAADVVMENANRLILTVVRRHLLECAEGEDGRGSTDST